MLLHRPFATGLLGMACCLGVLWRSSLALDETMNEALGEPPPPAAIASAPAEAAPAEGSAPCLLRSPSVNVVDVAAAAATPELVAQLIRLADDERVTAVDDSKVVNDLAAGAWIASRFQRGSTDPDGVGRALLVDRRAPIERGDYIDLTLEREACSRRVLVLFH